MLGTDPFVFLLKSLVLFIYGLIFAFSVIFTLSIESYRRLDEYLGMNFLTSRIINPIIESNINFLDEWLIKHHKIIGPLLILLSIIDTVMLLRFIDLL